MVALSSYEPEIMESNAGRIVKTVYSAIWRTVGPKGIDSWLKANKNHVYFSHKCFVDYEKALLLVQCLHVCLSIVIYSTIRMFIFPLSDGKPFYLTAPLEISAKSFRTETTPFPQILS